MWRITNDEQNSKKLEELRGNKKTKFMEVVACPTKDLLLNLILSEFTYSQVLGDYL